MSKLIDVFLYSGNHEDDVVSLRYQTMRKHVDEMVAISCNLTYQGEKSPCEAPPRELDIGWAVVLAEPPEGKSEWGGEHWGWVEGQHRDLITEKLPHMIEVSDDDIVMISDFDEIVDPRFIPEIRAGVNLYGWTSVPMRMHGFALDYLYPNQLYHTVACRYDKLEPQKQRNSRYSAVATGYGWHFSWLGDKAAKERKLKWFSHGELENLDLDNCYEQGIHAEGTELIKLDEDDIGNMCWPEPIMNGDFAIPKNWWSPTYAG